MNRFPPLIFPTVLLLVAGAAVALPGEDLSALDDDRDGRLSLAEQESAARIRFERVDSDHDGALSLGEMDTLQISQGHGKSGAALIARMDANGDGKLTRYEHLAGARNEFAQLDRDADGRLSAIEMQPDAPDRASQQRIAIDLDPDD